MPATAEAVCYGPIAPGQFFLDPYSPESSPSFYRIYGVLMPGVFLCEKWRMREKRGDFSFRTSPTDKGWQVARSMLSKKHRVSPLQARHYSEQALRTYDDAYRARYPQSNPVRIVRCCCGVGDEAPQITHALGCFFRRAI